MITNDKIRKLRDFFEQSSTITGAAWAAMGLYRACLSLDLTIHELEEVADQLVEHHDASYQNSLAYTVLKDLAKDEETAERSSRKLETEDFGFSIGKRSHKPYIPHDSVIHELHGLEVA